MMLPQLYALLALFSSAVVTSHPDRDGHDLYAREALFDSDNDFGLYARDDDDFYLSAREIAALRARNLRHLQARAVKKGGHPKPKGLPLAHYCRTCDKKCTPALATNEMICPHCGTTNCT